MAQCKQFSVNDTMISELKTQLSSLVVMKDNNQLRIA